MNGSRSLLHAREYAQVRVTSRRRKDTAPAFTEHIIKQSTQRCLPKNINGIGSCDEKACNEGLGPKSG